MNTILRISAAAGTERKSPSRSGRRGRRFLQAAGIIGVAVFALAGCASEPPAASGQESSAPVETKPPINSSVPCSAAAGTGPWGDVIAKEEITDTNGSYCHTTIDPNSPAAQFDISKVDVDSLTKYGFTTDDAEAAHKFAVPYLAEVMLDSSRLDDYSLSDTAWFETIRSSIAVSSQPRFEDAIKDRGLKGAGLIVTESLPTPLGRDGGPRAFQTNISVDRIAADTDFKGAPVLVVRTSATVLYDASNESVVAAALRNDATKTEEGLRASNPNLFQTDRADGLILQGKFVLGFGIGNSEALSGIADVWTLTTADGSLVVGEEK